MILILKTSKCEFKRGLLLQRLGQGIAVAQECSLAFQYEEVINFYSSVHFLADLSLPTPASPTLSLAAGTLLTDTPTTIGDNLTPSHAATPAPRARGVLTEGSLFASSRAPFFKGFYGVF